MPDNPAPITEQIQTAAQIAANVPGVGNGAPNSGTVGGPAYSPQLAAALAQSGGGNPR